MEARGAKKFLQIKTITDICWADIHCVPDPLLRVYMQYPILTNNPTILLLFLWSSESLNNLTKVIQHYFKPSQLFWLQICFLNQYSILSPWWWRFITEQAKFEKVLPKGDLKCLPYCTWFPRYFILAMPSRSCQ